MPKLLAWGTLLVLGRLALRHAALFALLLEALRPAAGLSREFAFAATCGLYFLGQAAQHATDRLILRFGGAGAARLAAQAADGIVLAPGAAGRIRIDLPALHLGRRTTLALLALAWIANGGSLARAARIWARRRAVVSTCATQTAEP